MIIILVLLISLILITQKSFFGFVFRIWDAVCALARDGHDMYMEMCIRDRIDASSYGIEKDSVILLEQLRTIDKKRLKDKVCHLDQTMLDRVNHALEISLELTF